MAKPRLVPLIVMGAVSARHRRGKEWELGTGRVASQERHVSARESFSHDLLVAWRFRRSVDVQSKCVEGKGSEGGLYFRTWAHCRMPARHVVVGSAGTPRSRSSSQIWKRRRTSNERENHRSDQPV